MVDRGNKFLAEFKTMIQANYSIKVKPITSRNPQDNSVLERVHQIIGNIIHTFNAQKIVSDDENPWDGILESIMFTLHATVHTIMLNNPAQFVFKRDSILKTRHEVN